MVAVALPVQLPFSGRQRGTERTTGSLTAIQALTLTGQRCTLVQVKLQSTTSAFESQSIGCNQSTTKILFKAWIVLFTR